MRTRRAATFAVATILFVAPLSARAGDGRIEADLLVGAAFPSHESGQGFSSTDEFGTRTVNAIHSEARKSLSYGASLRYVSSSGLGVEVLYERAKLDLKSTNQYTLAWDSIAGPQTESYPFTDSGKLEVDPLSLNILYRAELLPWMALKVSGGFTYEKVELDDRSPVGLVSYIGDSIETFAAETRAEESKWKATWNAGADLEFGLFDRLSIFVDGRYYANARGTVNGRHVQPGSYAGLHLGGSVAVDAAAAARYDAQISASAYSADIDTKMVRAAVGLRFRF